MSKIGNNPILKGIRGMLGGVVVFKEVRGQMILANRPKSSTKELTEKQIGRRDKFKRAAFYAKRMMKNPDMKALYATGVTLTKFAPYVVAVSDFLKAPVIREVTTDAYTGAAGQTIIVNATDDFQVKSVQVTITDASGLQLEKGEATLTEDAFEDWHYVTTSATPTLTGVKITVDVSDTAGNVTTKEILK